jgi:hypothetical protein
MRYEKREMRVEQRKFRLKRLEGLRAKCSILQIGRGLLGFGHPSEFEQLPLVRTK